MKRRPRTGSSRLTTTAAPPTCSPEVVGFIAAILRQMDHAANLVVAFFRSVGMMGPHDHSLPDLPREFLLELGALLQAREWHAAGLIDWFDSEGLSIDDMIGRAIERLKNDPAAVAAGRCRKGGSTGSRRTSRGGVRPSPADRQSPRQPSETGRLYKASRGDRT